MLLLNAEQIKQKVKRLAIEIVENNYKEEELILAGINNNGLHFAKILEEAINSIELYKLPVKLVNITLNPAKPVSEPVLTDIPLKDLAGKAIVVIDDVANTGRTLQYALKPLLEIVPKKVEFAVLIDRKHKDFPVQVEYVGLSLSTTFKEYIDVQIREVEKGKEAVYLR